MAPVSGSKNTKIEGMMVRIATFKISLKSGLLRDAISLKYKIKVSLVSSLGWKESMPKLNQALAPLVSFPKNKTRTNRIIDNQ